MGHGQSDINMLSIDLSFKSELDSTKAFPYLFKEVLKDFFIPIGVKYGFTSKDVKPLRGVLGLNPESVHFSSSLFQNEELMTDICLTKYQGDDCLSELLGIVSKAKIERGPIHLVGIVNTYYQKNTSVKRNWFLREMNVGEFMSLGTGGVTKYQTEEYLNPILKISVIKHEKYWSINFTTYSNVFLKKRFKRISYNGKDYTILGNDKAGELNWNGLIEVLNKFSHTFLPYLEETDFTLEGSLYFNEFDRLRERCKTLPKFADSEYNFMRAKKKEK